METIIFEDCLSSLIENTQKCLNYSIIKIFLSIIFECELPTEYKK